MTFDNHIEKIKNSFPQRCGILCKMRSYYPRKNLIRYYNSYNCSRLEYFIYGRTTKYKLDKNIVLQKKPCGLSFFLIQVTQLLIYFFYQFPNFNGPQNIC